MAIKKNYLVEKSNVLNQMRTNNMSLQELRFLSIYIAKINARDLTTRNVRFTVEDFQKIMDLSRLKIDYLKTVTNSLLSKVVNVPNESGGYTGFQLFKRCKVYNENSIWYIEIDAHDEALPLMFEFKKNYFTYQLWNALRLKSSNQLRMYEILKQYELIGERIISIKELKNLIGIKENEYLRYDRFKTCVLDVCQSAICENTDICYTYEPYGKKGQGGKVINLKFKIFKNTNFKDPLHLDDFLTKSELGINEDTVCIENDKPIKQKEDNNTTKVKNKFINELNANLKDKEIEKLIHLSENNIDKLFKLIEYSKTQNIKNLLAWFTKMLKNKELDFDSIKLKDNKNKNTNTKSKNKFNNFTNHEWDEKKVNDLLIKEQEYIDQSLKNNNKKEQKEKNDKINPTEIIIEKIKNELNIELSLYEARSIRMKYSNNNDNLIDKINKIKDLNSNIDKDTFMKII